MPSTLSTSTNQHSGFSWDNTYGVMEYYSAIKTEWKSFTCSKMVRTEVYNMKSNKLETLLCNLMLIHCKVNVLVTSTSWRTIRYLSVSVVYNSLFTYWTEFNPHVDNSATLLPHSPLTPMGFSEHTPTIPPHAHSPYLTLLSSATGYSAYLLH